MDPPPSEKIKQELLSWKGVTIHEHNSVTILCRGSRDGSHLHGDSIADLKFPAKVGDRLVKDGYVSPHHVIAKSRWISHEIRDNKDVEKVIELFRLQYNLLGKQK